MMNRRITLFCSSFPPETGAAPGRMYKLAMLLQEKGYCITVITAMPNYPTGRIFEQYKKKLICRENLNGIQVIRIWFVPTNSSRKIDRVVSVCSYCISLLSLGFWYLLKSKPAVLIMSSPPFVTGYIGLLLSRFSKAKTLLNISDLWPETAVDLGFISKGRFYNFLLHLEWKMYRRADAFSVQSEQIRDYITIHEGVKPVFVYRNLQPEIPQARVARPQGQRKIVYAGLLGIAQGVFSVLQSIDFASLGTEFHIYGHGNEQEKIISWIKEHPDRSVYYHGSVPADVIPDLLTRYHAMLIPLYTEIRGAVPSKIFNAMANGLPVLFSGSGEAAEIIQRTKTGFVNPPGDYKKLEENIEKLIMLNAGGYELMRGNCFSCAETEFNKIRQDESFIRFLQQLDGTSE